MDPNRRASDDGWEEVTQGRSFDGLSVQQGRFQASSQVLVRRAPHNIPPTRMDFCCAVDRQAPILTKPFNLLRMRIVMITTITAFATISPTSSPRYVLPHLYSPFFVNPSFFLLLVLSSSYVCIRTGLYSVRLEHLG
jgi:hypothetical protein